MQKEIETFCVTSVCNSIHRLLRRTLVRSPFLFTNTTPTTITTKHQKEKQTFCISTNDQPPTANESSVNCQLSSVNLKGKLDVLS